MENRNEKYMLFEYSMLQITMTQGYEIGKNKTILLTDSFSLIKLFTWITKATYESTIFLRILNDILDFIILVYLCLTKSDTLYA